MWINYVSFDEETTPAPTITLKVALPRSISRVAESSVAQKGWPKLREIADFFFSGCSVCPNFAHLFAGVHNDMSPSYVVRACAPTFSEVNVLKMCPRCPLGYTLAD
jgi:hypothetical protein